MDLLESIEIEADDRRLLGAFAVVGLATMSVGGLFALLMKLVRTPALSILPAETYYQALTGHGILMFIFWMGFVQTAFLVVAGSVLIRRRLWSYRLAWAGLGAMTLAAALALAGVLQGTNITYHAAIPLAAQYPGAWMIFLSFVILAAGMLLIVLDFALTVLGAVERKGDLDAWAALFRSLPVASFAALAGLFIAVPGLFAALRMFGLAWLWSIGRATVDPGMYRMDWHIVFHIYHYVPALTLVGVAYVLVELTADARSVYAKPLAKSLFLLYPVFVPPTFVYHLLADPSLPQQVKLAGTVLSLLVGVPTVLHTFIIVGMLEARMRQAGFDAAAGLRRLPWGNPAFGSLAVGLVTLFVGGLMAYALIQEQLAPMLHNTFLVPAYVHPIAAGGANITYMGALYYGIPMLLRRRLWGLRLARWQPYVMGAALIWMAIFGAAAGLAGVPRRYASVGLDAPAAWATWMNLALGVGAMVAIGAGIVFVGTMLMTAVAGEKVASPQAAVAGMGPLPPPVVRSSGWTLLALVPGTVFVVGVVVLTVLAFQRLWGMPVQLP
ncbi:hypothetical protein DCC79_13900 [bacterium]|nr:hypothetical protein [Chloroflexi bacterium CFX6]RIL08403.1 MAG: hypothetical protein DCC79_13900 [bacterium]